MFGNLKWMGQWPVIVVAIGLFCSSAAVAKKPPKPPDDDSSAGYNLVVLTPLGADTFSSRVGDLDENGNVVGSYQDVPNNPIPFYYDAAANEYITLSGGQIALGINNLGAIAGGHWDLGAALYWPSPAADPATLSPLPGDVGAIAGDINDAGMISGRSFGESRFPRGVVWQIDAAGEVSGQVELPPLAGDDTSLSYRINEADEYGVAQIAGSSGIKGQAPNSETATAVVWEVGPGADGTLELLSGPVGVGTPAGAYSVGFAINNLGDVCGESDNWPFVALSGGTAEPLAGLGNADTGSASDLNDVGQVVGDLHVWKKPLPGFRAILWDNGQAIELEKKVSLTRWERLESAQEINNAGMIAGDGTFLDFISEGGAFLLVPK